MMKFPLKYLFVAAVVMLSAGEAFAQKYPERRSIRLGNREYQMGGYTASETAYRQALEADPGSYEAQFNLGNSLYKQERYEEAAAIFDRLSKWQGSDLNRANTHYNAGNALFQQRKLEEALEEYKKALRINPGDMEAKFNLAYVKKLLEKDDDENNEDQDDQNDDNQDNQDDQNNDGDGNGDQDSNDDQQDDSDDKGEDDQDNNDSDGDQRPDEQGMTREQAEQLLDAMQMNEDRTREKVDEENAKAATARSIKNW